MSFPGPAPVVAVQLLVAAVVVTVVVASAAAAAAAFLVLVLAEPLPASVLASRPVFRARRQWLGLAAQAWAVWAAAAKFPTASGPC